MTLYISNPSKQDAVFFYRLGPSRNDLPFAGHENIPRGKQVEVQGSKFWSREDHALVIRQLQERGAREAADTNQPMGRFQGFIYEVEHPVTESEIAAAHESTMAHAEQRSVEEATKSALAFDKTMQMQQSARTRGQKIRPVRTTTVEVVQDLMPHSHATGDEVMMSVTVDPDGVEDPRFPLAR